MNALALVSFSAERWSPSLHDPMRIRAYSDLHLEFGTSEPPAKIRGSPSFGRLRPIDTRTWHARTRIWLSAQLELHHEGPTVVVTHHAPTLRGCKPEDAATPFLGAYASDVEALMGPKIDTWVFGHTHVAFDEVPR